MNISNLHKITSLRKREEIRFVLENGRKIRTKYGLIFVLKEIKKDNKRAAILLKKNIGSAVKRNYVKRILRSIIRTNHGYIFNSYNCVLFLFNYKGPINFALIEKEYRNIFLNDMAFNEK